MGQITALSSFVAFCAAAFHLYVAIIFNKKFHKYLAIAWMCNFVYLFFEPKSLLHNSEFSQLNDYAAYLISLLSIPFFGLAYNRISRGYRFRLGHLIAAIGVVFFPFVLIQQNRQFSIDVIPGSLASAVVLSALGVAVAKIRATEFESLLRPTTLKRDLGKLRMMVGMHGPIADRHFDDIVRSCEKKAATGISIIGISYAVYGLLQIVYPSQEIMRDFSENLWILIFVIAFLLKIGGIAGFVMLLSADVKMSDAVLRLGSFAGELNAVTAAVEHDMRAPISMLRRLHNRMRRKHQHDSTIVSYADDIRKIVNRVRAVTDLIVSVKEGKIDYEKRSVKCGLNEVLMRSAKAAKIQYAESKPVVRIECSGHLLIFAYVDRLSQAFTNIINNAIEASVECGRVPLVEVKGNMVDNKLVVDIQDKGCGMCPDDLSMVFEPYYSTKREKWKVNRGLGLFIANWIMKTHQGEISISSQKNVGTTVTVTLPAISGSMAS